MVASTARGTVLAVFERSAYLDIDGRIVALASAELGCGPMTIAIEPFEFLQPVQTGDGVSLEGRVLRVGTHEVDLTNTTAWDPTLPVPDGDVSRDLALAALKTVRDELMRGASPDSIAPLLKEPAQGSPEAPRLAPLRRGLHMIGDFLSGRARAGDAADVVAADIAGRGPGLTPSGDDLLTGIMHAITVWPQIAAAAGGRDARRLLAEAALPHTTRISGAYLDAAANGQAGEPWHALVRGLAESPAAWRRAARRLLNVGETSGADALTGLCWAWRRLA